MGPTVFPFRCMGGSSWSCSLSDDPMICPRDTALEKKDVKLASESNISSGLSAKDIPVDFRLSRATKGT